MAKKKKGDAEREERITNEILVDCTDRGERAMGWYCCVEDNPRFTLLTRCIVVYENDETG